ncbi:hypothetical protein H5410_019285 [Solanum commersonii]|uniref:Uncharacterized protein n=1 Tax=Solanum commersonii TaxID=4109 RepID=A0A9J6A4I3_SOLCO|nr:hypothetical protein H5410_019285 [Solanum commersonii]
MFFQDTSGSPYAQLQHNTVVVELRYAYDELEDMSNYDLKGYNENVAFGVEDLMHNNLAMKKRRIIQVAYTTATLSREGYFAPRFYDRLMAEMFAGKNTHP